MEEEIGRLKKRLSIIPEDRAAWEHLVRCLLRSGLISEARKAYFDTLSRFDVPAISEFIAPLGLAGPRTDHDFMQDNDIQTDVTGPAGPEHLRTVTCGFSPNPRFLDNGICQYLIFNKQRNDNNSIRVVRLSDKVETDTELVGPSIYLGNCLLNNGVPIFTYHAIRQQTTHFICMDGDELTELCRYDGIARLIAASGGSAWFSNNNESSDRPLIRLTLGDEPCLSEHLLPRSSSAMGVLEDGRLLCGNARGLEACDECAVTVDISAIASDETWYWNRGSGSLWRIAGKLHHFSRGARKFREVIVPEGCGWFAFTGRFGERRIVEANRNGKKHGTGVMLFEFTDGELRLLARLPVSSLFCRKYPIRLMDADLKLFSLHSGGNRDGNRDNRIWRDILIVWKRCGKRYQRISTTRLDRPAHTLRLGAGGTIFLLHEDAVSTWQ